MNLKLYILTMWAMIRDRYARFAKSFRCNHCVRMVEPCPGDHVGAQSTPAIFTFAAVCLAMVVVLPIDLPGGLVRHARSSHRAVSTPRTTTSPLTTVGPNPSPLPDPTPKTNAHENRIDGVSSVSFDAVQVASVKGGRVEDLAYYRDVLVAGGFSAEILPAETVPPACPGHLVLIVRGDADQLRVALAFAEFWWGHNRPFQTRFLDGHTACQYGTKYDSQGAVLP